MIKVETSDIEILKTLNAGDIVSISGTIYTARDAAHKKIFVLMKDDKPLPFPLQNSFVYYTGATPAKDGEPYGSCGPTTSKRMDVYTPDMLDAGLKGIIGKGARTRAVVDAIKRNGAVYFVAIGGAGAFYKSAIKSAEVIAFPELLSEAVTKLEVEGFECVVGVDSKGNDIFNK